METLFVVAKIMESPGKNDSLLFHPNCFKRAYDHYKVLSMIMTIAVLLHLATHKSICDVRCAVVFVN